MKISPLMKALSRLLPASDMFCKRAGGHKFGQNYWLIARQGARKPIETARHGQCFSGDGFWFPTDRFYPRLGFQWGFWPKTAGSGFSSIIFQQILYGLVALSALYFLLLKLITKILRRFAFPLLLFRAGCVFFGFCLKVGLQSRRSQSVNKYRARFFFQPSEF